jgi:hypothetical protein
MLRRPFARGGREAASLRAGLLWLGVASSCGHLDTGGARDVGLGAASSPGGSLSKAELQEDVQRFSGQFIAGLIDASSALGKSPTPGVTEQAMRLAATTS